MRAADVNAARSIQGRSIDLQVVLDRSATVEWRTSLWRRIRRGDRVFASSFCYLHPSSGEVWLRRSARNIAAPLAQPDFLSAASTVFSHALKASSLTLVDLGVGDMVRARSFLQMAIDADVIRQFIMVDINRDLLSLHRSSINPTVMETLRSVRSLGPVTALHCDYRFLYRHQPLLHATERTCLLMLGNTLGIERHPVRVLRRLRRALRCGDQIVLELQAVEENGLSDSELTDHFKADMDFYAGPLLALGVPRDRLDLVASTTRSAHNIETIAVKVIVSSDSPIERNVSVARGSYQFMSIARFDEAAIERLLRFAGFEVVAIYRSDCGVKSRLVRPFYYVNACVSSQA